MPLKSCLFFSFIRETRILKLNKNLELEETQVFGFDLSQSTIFCSNIGINGEFFIQVTSNSIGILNMEERMINIQPKSPITLAKCCSNFTIICLTGGIMLLYELQSCPRSHDPALKSQQAEFKQLELVQMENEISGIGMNEEFVAVCTWEQLTLHIYSLPNLHLLTKTKLDGDVVSRSIEFSIMENQLYLLCGMADGFLITYTFNSHLANQIIQKKQRRDENMQISMSESVEEELQILSHDILLNKKIITLGTYSVILSKFIYNGAENIFACTDCPTIVFSCYGKIQFSHMNSTGRANLIVDSI